MKKTAYVAVLVLAVVGIVFPRGAGATMCYRPNSHGDGTVKERAGGCVAPSVAVPSVDLGSSVFSARATTEQLLITSPVPVIQSQVLPVGNYVAIATVTVSRFSSDADGTNARGIYCAIGSTVQEADVAPGDGSTITIVVPIALTSPGAVTVTCERGTIANFSAGAYQRSLVVVAVGSLVP